MATTKQEIKQATSQVEWKLLFNQLFAHEIKKEHVLGTSPQDATEELYRLLQAYTQYAPETFHEAIDAITAPGRANDAYEARQELYENPAHRRLISDLDFNRCVGRELRNRECVRRFLDEIWRHRDRPISEEENFFESPEGRAATEAFQFDGKKNKQQVALVFAPGYAAHTVKYALFEEIVQDINSFYGRPQDRPLLHEDGIDLEFEDFKTFYGRRRKTKGGFDILQPLGRELGNTTGDNAETTDLLHDWITSLPKRYARSKLIFFGYSKGAPISLELASRHPKLSRRTLGYITLGGVVQGSHVARQVLEQADTLLRDVPVGEFVDELRAKAPEHLGKVLSPLFADVDLSWLSVPRIRAVFDILGYDITPLERQIDRLLGSRELREVLEGVQGLSPKERVRWNLAHLDNDTFRDPAFIMNLSALTDVRDFVRPTALRRGGAVGSSLIVPAITPDGDLDWQQLSLDALFLYVTSIEGFKSAPGGLYDTQVALGGTKTPLIDERPLSASLTSDELRELWDDKKLRKVLKRNGVESLDALTSMPRRRLTPDERCDNIDAIDLGEFKGHHWAPFVQALRPPPELSEEHAVWDFPRKAFMRAVIQVLALYNLARHSKPTALTALADEPGSELAPEVTAGADGHRDVVLYRTEAVEPTRKHLSNLYNLAARASTYGLVVNSARTGLGTTTPVGPALSVESLYYQALRVYSYFDWEFRRGLLHDPSVWPLPRSLALVVGRFPAEFADTFPEEEFERLEQVRKASKVLLPKLEPFELRRLGQGDYAILRGAPKVTFSDAIRDNLRRGTKAKLEAIERDAYDTDTVDVETKLQAMLGAFTPLCTIFSATFDRSTPQQSATQLTVYLPAYHTLHADDLDQPGTWYLEKGAPGLKLPRPVQLDLAEITHIRYLHEANPAKKQAIKLEITRDFAGRDRVTTAASFGRLFDGPDQELFAFDESDHRDALHVVFRPRFAMSAGETPADNTFREAFNRVFGAFEVEARIHSLSLQMRRASETALPALEDDDAILRPRFSVEGSRISFRVHRYVDTAVERLPLQAAGFTCREDYKGPHRFHCFRDFWTWDHLRDEFFYGGGLSTGRFALPKQFRERLLEQVVGTATRAVVDRSIKSIEDAIDEEIGRIAEDNLRRYAKARTVLVERLHAGLF